MKFQHVYLNRNQNTNDMNERNTIQLIGNLRVATKKPELKMGEPSLGEP